MNTCTHVYINTLTHVYMYTYVHIEAWHATHPLHHAVCGRALCVCVAECCSVSGMVLCAAMRSWRHMQMQLANDRNDGVLQCVAVCGSELQCVCDDTCKCNSPMPEMMVCFVSASKPTRKVGSSRVNRLSAFENLSRLPLDFGDKASDMTGEGTCIEVIEYLTCVCWSVLQCVAVYCSVLQWACVTGIECLTSVCCVLQ